MEVQLAGFDRLFSLWNVLHRQNLPNIAFYDFVWHMNGSPKWVPLHLFPLPNLPSTISLFLPFQIPFSSIRDLMSRLTSVLFRSKARPTVSCYSFILQEKTVTLTLSGWNRRCQAQTEISLFTCSQVTSLGSSFSFLRSFWLQWSGMSSAFEGFSTGTMSWFSQHVPCVQVGPELSSPIMLWPLDPEGDLDGMHFLEPDFTSPGALWGEGVRRPVRGQGLRVWAQTL